MRKSLISLPSLAQIRRSLCSISMLTMLSLCACSALPQGISSIVAPQPPAHPVLPRPAPLKLQPYTFGVQPAVGNKPPFVTLGIDQYTILENDLNALLADECEKSWLLDYYEGKHDGPTPPKDYCLSQPAPQVQGPISQTPAK